MPKGWEVHHVNEVKTDNEPENLVVCKEKRGHALLHCVPSLIKYAAWLGAIGASVRVFTVPEPEGMRWCTRCGQLKGTTDFYRYSYGALRGHCKECH